MPKTHLVHIQSSFEFVRQKQVLCGVKPRVANFALRFLKQHFGLFKVPQLYQDKRLLAGANFHEAATRGLYQILLNIEVASISLDPFPVYFDISFF